MRLLSSVVLRSLGLAILCALTVVLLTSGTMLGALMLFAGGIVALLFAELYEDRAISKREGTAPLRTFRIVDFLFFLSALPFIFTIFHEFLICPFFPSLGIHGGDNSYSCTIGWGFFALLYALPVWLAALIAIAPWRLRTLKVIGRKGLATRILLWVSIVMPLALILMVVIQTL